MGELPPPPARVGPLKLFLAFLSVTAIGFGGVMPWARRMIVERKRWLTPEEFNDVLALCQFLPGSNIVNLSVAMGARMAGALGSLAAFLGVVGLPVIIVMLLGASYHRWGGLAPVQGALTAMSAAAAGLVIATAAKMTLVQLRRRPVQALPFMLAAFVMVGIFRWPLEWVVLGLCPFSIAAATWARA